MRSFLADLVSLLLAFTVGAAASGPCADCAATEPTPAAVELPVELHADLVP